MAIAMPAVLLAVQQSGSVRAADQFVPGATVTARQGDMKVVAYTDENGRYTLNLAPGVWDIEVQILGFTKVQNQVTVGAEPVFKEWTLEMPRLAGTNGPQIPASAAATNTRRRGPGGGGQGQGRDRVRAVEDKAGEVLAEVAVQGKSPTAVAGLRRQPPERSRHLPQHPGHPGRPLEQRRPRVPARVSRVPDFRNAAPTVQDDQAR